MSLPKLNRFRLTAGKRIRAFSLVTAAGLTLSLATGFALPRTTYVIQDGDASITVADYQGRPEEALAQAGLTLSAADRLVSLPGDGVTSLTVLRALPVSIRDGESVISALTWDESVGEVLQRLHITVGERDLLLSDPGEPAGEAEIRIVRDAISFTTESQPIPYERTRQAGPELYRGEEQVLQPGVDGERTLFHRTVTVDGQSERTLLSDEVTREPVTEVVAYGTKVRPVQRSSLSVTANAVTNIEEDGSGGGVLTTSAGETLSYSKVLSVSATAYTTERQSWKRTATGTTARVGAIAVDPKVIPYGTRMYIQSADGSILYGVATAEDCGGAIKGNKVDLFFNTYNECIQFGVRKCTIYILK